MSARIAQGAPQRRSELNPTPEIAPVTSFGFPAARRDFLRALSGSLILAASSPLFAEGSAIVAVRVWPSRDYTRVTLELDAPLKYTHQLIKDPDRLVLDLEDLVLTGKLRDIVAQIAANDPFIGSVRAGQFKARVVRLVFDLKTEIKPQVFALKPVGEYGHRLVLDLYPATPPDPLLAFMDKQALPQDMVPRDGDAPAGTQRGEGAEPIVRDGAPKSDSARTDVPRTETAKAESRRDEMRPAKQQVARMITINPGVIKGGLKVNQIPHECVMELDIRIPMGFEREAILEDVEDNLSHFPGTLWEVIEDHSYKPSMADPDGEMVRILQRNAEAAGGIWPIPLSSLGGSDSRYWRWRGVPAYLYGPSPVSMGRGDEHVTVEEYLHIVRVHALSAFDFLTA